MFGTFQISSGLVTPKPGGTVPCGFSYELMQTQILAPALPTGATPVQNRFG
jgi:hypothetical protein